MGEFSLIAFTVRLNTDFPQLVETLYRPLAAGE
jgi:hypothetical protein